MSGPPDTWAEVRFGEINSFTGRNVDPSATPTERFELYSVPTFPTRAPESALGSEIGSTKQAVEPDDVLVCKINPRINRVWQVIPLRSHRQIASSEWIVMRAKGLNPSFLRHYFCSPAFRERICEGLTGVGGSLTRAQPKRVAQFPVPLAPLPEQQRISDKLDALLARVDACHERLDRMPGILKRFRQSVRASATSGELTKEWREERGRDIAQWTTSCVGQVIVGIEAGLNVQCEERPPQSDEKGLVKISAVTWGAYDDDESKTLPKLAAVPERSRVRAGDFLISRANTLELVGACVIVRRVTRPVFLSDKVLRLVMPEEWKPWLLLVLQSPLGRREIETRASGNQLSMRNLSQAGLRDIQIPVPPSDERAEIVRRAEVLLARADELERRVHASRSAIGGLTPSLLAKAFRGELVPQNPSDEPAFALLERLRSERAGASIEPTRAARRVAGRQRDAKKTAPASQSRRAIQARS